MGFVWPVTISKVFQKPIKFVLHSANSRKLSCHKRYAMGHWRSVKVYNWRLVKQIRSTSFAIQWRSEYRRGRLTTPTGGDYRYYNSRGHCSNEYNHQRFCLLCTGSYNLGRRHPRLLLSEKKMSTKLSCNPQYLFEENKHIEAETRWPPFSRRHFQMHFLEWKFQWSLFPMVQLTIFQHWFRLWVGAGQATSHYLKQWWLVYWRMYASLGFNELIHSEFLSFLDIEIAICKDAEWVSLSLF